MITKTSLAKEVNKQFQGTIGHDDALKMVNFVFDKINEHLYASKKINLTNFMTLYLDPVPEREFFHPQKQQKEMLPAHWKLVTKISPTLNGKIKQKPCYLPSNKE